MKAKIADFQKIINDFFAMTGKRIEIEGSKFSVLTDTGVLPVEALSSGEKANSIDFAESVPAKWKRSHRNDR